MKQAKIIIIIIIVATVIGGLLIWKFTKQASAPSPTQRACTQEAKVCEDGSSVGRIGPNCEFAECNSRVENNNILEYNPYTIKNNKVFFKENELSTDEKELFEIEGVDVKSFKYIGICYCLSEMPYCQYYAIDKNNVYIGAEPSKIIDAQTFEYLGVFGNESGMPYSVGIARDKKNIYYRCGKINKDINISNYKLFSNGYAKDNKNVYFLDNIIRADAKSFDVFEKQLDPERKAFGFDEKNVYYDGCKVKNVVSENCINDGLLRCLPKNWDYNLDCSYGPTLDLY